MILTPSPYARLDYATTEPVSVIITDVSSGVSYALSGTYIRAWKGKRGITVEAYNSVTGETETVYHLNTDHVKLIGVIVRGTLIPGESYVMGYRDWQDVFGQNV